VTNRQLLAQASNMREALRGSVTSYDHAGDVAWPVSRAEIGTASTEEPAGARSAPQLSKLVT
jgi:hypothetical protein